ncbi:MAG: Tricarboxylate transport protein TctC [Ramlibacter sp.]|nr:Tricarboxylate transport protein TctC [Ramlibacter sp.]
MNLMSRRIALVLSCLVCIVTPLAAQDFPVRPVTIVVPFPPGGGTDIAARTLAERMTPLLGQTVLVVNRPGAGGNIGAQSVARSPGDGYTLLMATQGTHGSNASLYKELGYDTVADFTPISLVAATPLILVTSSKQPINNLRELVELAKSKPGVLNYGSSSVGGSPHLAMELLKMLTGISMLHVPYQGSAPLRSALLSGDIAVMFDNVPSSLPLVRDGRFRALGVSGAERSSSAPDVPTVAEAGVPGFEVSAWYGIVAPANVPANVVARLNAAIVQTLRTKEVSDKLVDLGFQPVGSTPATFAAQIKTDLDKYRRLIKAANITLQ